MMRIDVMRFTNVLTLENDMAETIYKTVKTRKPHICHSCQGVIPIGRKVECFTVLGDGEISNGYFCEICTLFLYEHRDEYTDEINEGDFISDVNEWLDIANQWERENGESFGNAVYHSTETIN